MYLIVLSVLPYLKGIEPFSFGVLLLVTNIFYSVLPYKKAKFTKEAEDPIAISCAITEIEIC